MDETTSAQLWLIGSTADITASFFSSSFFGHNFTLKDKNIVTFCNSSMCNFAHLVWFGDFWLFLKRLQHRGQVYSCFLADCHFFCPHYKRAKTCMCVQNGFYFCSPEAEFPTFPHGHYFLGFVSWINWIFVEWRCSFGVCTAWMLLLTEKLPVFQLFLVLFRLSAVSLAAVTLLSPQWRQELTIFVLNHFFFVSSCFPLCL